MKELLASSTDKSIVAAPAAMPNVLSAHRAKRQEPDAGGLAC